MDDRQRKDVFVPLAGPPQVARPDPAIYAGMGEDAIYQMLADFYRELEQSDVRHLFPDDMRQASERSAAFFVGLLGGPPRYHERYGNPALRARHLPFRIDEDARRTWLRCFERVLAHAPERYNFPPEHLDAFRHWLQEFSRWMVNAR